MKIHIQFLKTDTSFKKKYEKNLEKLIKDTAEKTAEILDLKIDNLNFTVYPYDKNIIDGFTQAPDWIRISVPKKFNENELKGVVCHEMCHVGMDYSYYSGRKNFLETLFAEGLAVVFEKEQTGKIPPYVRYNSSFIKKLLPKLKKQNLFSKDFNYYEWFYGQGKKPKFLGYKLGRYFIDRIQKNFPNLTVADRIEMRPNELFKLSKVNLD
jgi:uncharacterized protein YjaZ